LSDLFLGHQKFSVLQALYRQAARMSLFYSVGWLLFFAHMGKVLYLFLSVRVFHSIIAAGL